MTCYWSLRKKLLNGKRIPCVPPIKDNNRFFTDFKEKYQLFGHYFSEKCILLKNTSILPNIYSKCTNNSLDVIVFTKENIYKTIKNLDYGYDMISICMLKLCDISIYKNLLKISKFQKLLTFVKISL